MLRKGERQQQQQQHRRRRRQRRRRQRRVRIFVQNRRQSTRRQIFYLFFHERMSRTSMSADGVWRRRRPVAACDVNVATQRRWCALKKTLASGPLDWRNFDATKIAFFCVTLRRWAGKRKKMSSDASTCASSGKRECVWERERERESMTQDEDQVRFQQWVESVGAVPPTPPPPLATLIFNFPPPPVLPLIRPQQREYIRRLRSTRNHQFSWNLTDNNKKPKSNKNLLVNSCTQLN